MDPNIIYQDKNLLVLDKPAGWVVNDAQTTKDLLTIQLFLSKNFNYPLAKDRELRSGIVHRIDKETSGILLVAKNKDTFENLQKQFKERVINKTYLALVHGKLVSKDGTIDAPVGRLPWNRFRFGVLPGGRQSLTKYKVVNVFNKTLEKQKQYYSFLELCPKTGRTHQIRVHLKHIGHPIVSDEFYAGRKTARKDRTWCPRLFLHASQISIVSPTDGKKVEFVSKLPADLTKAFSTLTIEK